MEIIRSIRRRLKQKYQPVSNLKRTSKAIQLSGAIGKRKDTLNFDSLKRE
jgi:hypothetical protein